MEQIRADSRAAKLPSMKDSAVLESYILNEGIVQEVLVKCGKCMATDCKSCIKAGRANPKEEEVLTEMRNAMKKVKLGNGTYQFEVSYVVSEPLEDIFVSSKSNYESTPNRLTTVKPP